jgi:DNA-directed RNA polymerase specialized sigma24 family protein
MIVLRSRLFTEYAGEHWRIRHVRTGDVEFCLAFFTQEWCCNAVAASEVQMAPQEQPPATISDVCEILSNPQLVDDWTKRLIRIAAAFLARRTFRGGWHELPGGAPGAEDYVQEAFRRVLSGQREFRPDIPLFDILAGTLRSLIGHDGENPENRAVHDFFTSGDDGFDEAWVADPQSGGSVEEILEAHDLFENFRKDLPPHLQSCVDVCISDDFQTAEDRANALGVSVGDVRNMDKALRRRRQAWKGCPDRGM